MDGDESVVSLGNGICIETGELKVLPSTRMPGGNVKRMTGARGGIVMLLFCRAVKLAGWKKRGERKPGGEERHLYPGPEIKKAPGNSRLSIRTR